MRSIVGFQSGALVVLFLEALPSSAQEPPKKRAAQKPAAWVEPDKSEPAGMKYRTFQSKTTGGEVSYLIYLPPDYDRNKDREALYFHYPHYYPTTTPVSASRVGDWKLLEYHEDSRVELYNLKEDVGEAKDLAAKMSAKADELLRGLRAWRKGVNAQMPTPNPEFKRKDKERP